MNNTYMLWSNLNVSNAVTYYEKKYGAKVNLLYVNEADAPNINTNLNVQIVPFIIKGTLGVTHIENAG